MFTAYFDDSGSPDDTLAVVVAGFVASDEQWAEFERNWNDSLKQFGISLFHMKDFAHSVGEFSKFKGNKEDREWFLRQLLAHINVRVRHSCGHAVLMDDFRKVNSLLAFEVFGITPYSLCGRTCLASVSNWAKRWGIAEDQIRYVFEDGSKGKGTLEQRILRDKGITPVFKKKRESVPLQAADLFAYEMLAGNRDIFKKGVDSFDGLRYPIRQLSVLLRQPLDWGTYAQKDLEAFCENAGVPRRDSLAAKVCG
jgi:hypothetical protein